MCRGGSVVASDQRQIPWVHRTGATIPSQIAAEHQKSPPVKTVLVRAVKISVVRELIQLVEYQFVSANPVLETAHGRRRADERKREPEPLLAETLDQLAEYQAALAEAEEAQVRPSHRESFAQT